MKSLIPLILIVVAFGLGVVLGHNNGLVEGHAAGTKEALRTNPPSEEFEMACLGLWLGEQNKKYYEKDRRNAR